MHQSHPGLTSGAAPRLVIVTFVLFFTTIHAVEAADRDPDQAQATDQSGAATAETAARLHPGLGNYQREVASTSDEAREWFHHGLEWLYGFNHDEAVRSFEQAVALDPDFALAWWGIAYALGPHINNPVMTEEQSEAAFEATREALQRIDHAAPVEQALIRALPARYRTPPPEDRAELDQAFAAAMEEVWQRFPDDADVATLFAESLMNLQPWDLWTLDGEPKGRALEVVEVLEQAMELDQDHPGANHLYIHAVEASPEPERALEAAARLPDLVPGSGHLVHMPAHIHARMGQWDRASDANERAIEVDRAYFEAAPEPGFYIIYYLHNMHFLAWSAMMEGRYETALQAAREVERDMPEPLLQGMAFVADGFMPVTYHVLIRFGEWDRILNEPEPDDYRLTSRAHWHYARSLALTNLGRLGQARAELEQLEDLAEKMPDHWEISFNPSNQVAQLAVLMARGELAYHDGRPEDAFATLRKAVALEDRLAYAEPPAWMVPVRHALGALLLAEDRPDEAEQVYLADLERHPDNGWALLGLRQSLEAQDRTDEAGQVAARLQDSWRRADVQPLASCFCHPDEHEARRHRHGVVDFPVSGNEAAQRSIEAGLAHLHHMMYEQARPYFEAAAAADPDCAMAHWGIAMTSFQPLWHPTSSDNLERGKAALDRAIEIGAPTAREQGFIAAAAAFFTDPEPAAEGRAADHAARIKAWREAQRELHESFPDDVDAAAFYALAEVCQAMTEFSPTQERDYTRVRQAGALIEEFLEDHPEHPGLFHYLIHAYDSPTLAPRAEAVAREYDRLAPDSVHALHMPSHIFVRLGHWEETVEWNDRSANAARNEMRSDLHASAHYVHALDYMMYGYLNLGDQEAARETLHQVRQVDDLWAVPFAAYNTAAAQARYSLERGEWQEAARLEPRTPDALPWDQFPAADALFHYARGLGAARSGELDQARAESERIAALAAALHEDGDAYWGYMTEALGKAVDAWIRHEQGDTEQALALMSDAADLEDSMDKHPTTPGEVLPVRELYGELLLEEGLLDQAQQAFEASLERTPNRRNAMAGLAQVQRQRASR